MEVICAFSSDSRDLYKADIYRVLAMPVGHLIHFRYKKKYVSDVLLNEASSLGGKTLAIFFTRGNPLNSAPAICENISIRYATVVSASESAETDVFHVYMELGRFCDLTIVSGEIDSQPPNKFLSRLTCKVSPEVANWNSRVMAVKDYFPNILFFHIKKIRTAWSDPVALKTLGLSSRYCLNQGGRYIMEMAISNPTGTRSTINISEPNGYIQTNCVNPLECSAQFDDFEVPIFVKSLEVHRQASFVTFKPELEDFPTGEYATNIEVELKISPWRPMLFGALSVIAASSIAMVAPVSKSSVSPSMTVYFLSAILLFSSVSAMFYLFNKK